LFDQSWGAVGNDISAIDELAPKWDLQANRDRLAEIKQQLPQLRAVQEAAINHAASGERDAVIKAGSEFAEKATPATEAIKGSLGDMTGSFLELLDKNKDDLHAENRSLTLTTVVATLVALAAGMFLAFFLIRGITAGANREKLAAAEVAQGAERERIAAQDLTHKVDSILTVVSAAGQGDLTQEIQVRGSDAIGQMGEGLAKFFTDLRGSIASIGPAP
jgi:methyl-accepting chemotaxis protein